MEILSLISSDEEEAIDVDEAATEQQASSSSAAAGASAAAMAIPAVKVKKEKEGKIKRERQDDHANDLESSITGKKKSDGGGGPSNPSASGASSSSSAKPLSSGTCYKDALGKSIIILRCINLRKKAGGGRQNKILTFSFLSSLHRIHRPLFMLRSISHRAAICRRLLQKELS